MRWLLQHTGSIVEIARCGSGTRLRNASQLYDKRITAHPVDSELLRSDLAVAAEE